MFYVRYNLKTGQLTGWANLKGDLPLREGEAVANLDITKPDTDDYEYFVFNGKTLNDNPNKQPPLPTRDLAAEIDELKADVEKLKES